MMHCRRQTQNGFYPTAAYTTAANELDGSGAWKYRELVPDVSCESENAFKNISSNYTDVSGEMIFRPKLSESAAINTQAIIRGIAEV